MMDWKDQTDPAVLARAVLDAAFPHTDPGKERVFNAEQTNAVRMLVSLAWTLVPLASEANQAAFGATLKLAADSTENDGREFRAAVKTMQEVPIRNYDQENWTAYHTIGLLDELVHSLRRGFLHGAQAENYCNHIFLARCYIENDWTTRPERRKSLSDLIRTHYPTSPVRTW
jgi:hypothetical protein